MSLKDYINKEKSKTFKIKKLSTQKLIIHTLHILDSFGIPMDSTPRRLERMAIAFLAVCDVKNIRDFQHAKDLEKDAYA